MNNKTNKILAGVFALMLLIAIFPMISQKISGNKTENKKSNKSLDFSDYSEKSVSKITIKSVSGEKNFSFEDGKWQINNNEADEQKISELFADLKNMQVREMVSQNESNQAKFGVDKEASTKLIITKNDKDEVFLIGKAGNAAGQFYMRKDGIKNTYLVESPLFGKLSWDENKWKKEAEKIDSAEKPSTI